MTPQPPISLSLTVPAFRRYDLLTKMLASAQASILQPWRYIIVDNGGQFDWRMIETDPTIPDVHLYEPKRNLGVAAAWNYAIDHCRTEFLVIVNDDVVLGPTALSALADVLTDSTSCCATAGGSWSLFMVKPKLLIERVGHFDQNLAPAYFEDDDMTYRLKLAGDPAIKVPRVDHEHAGSATLATFDASERRAHDLAFGRNAAYYQKKWGGRPHEERHVVPFQGKPPRDWKLRPER